MNKDEWRKKESEITNTVIKAFLVLVLTCAAIASYATLSYGQEPAAPPPPANEEVYIITWVPWGMMMLGGRFGGWRPVPPDGWVWSPYFKRWIREPILYWWVPV